MIIQKPLPDMTDDELRVVVEIFGNILQHRHLFSASAIADSHYYVDCASLHLDPSLD